MYVFFANIFTWAGAFFVFGTIWFWLVSTAIFVWLIYFTERESHFAAVGVLIGFAWIVSSVNGFSIFANPLLVLKWVGLYLVVGTVWSFLKWFSFLFGKRDELKKIKADYIKKFARPLTSEGKIDPQDIDDFIRFLNEQRYQPNKGYDDITSQQEIIPSVSGRFGDLTRWIVWWPFSAFWTILNDPIRRLAEAIVRMFRGAYTRLANSVFSSEI